MVGTLFNTTILKAIPGAFATHGAEAFDAAVRQVEVSRAPVGVGRAVGPLDVHFFEAELRDAYMLDKYRYKPGYRVVNNNLNVRAWEERYPGIETAFDYNGTRRVTESPAWGRVRHPVSIDRVVEDFLLDGATLTFKALPRGAQKIVALKQIAKQLKDHPHLLESFADLVADTLHSVGVNFIYDLSCGVMLNISEVEEIEISSPEIRGIAEAVMGNFERVSIPSRENLEYYVSGNKVVAVVGPQDCPMPLGSLLPHIYGNYHCRAGKREVISQVVDDEYIVRSVDAEGHVSRYEGKRQIMTIQGQQHSVLESGSTLPIPEKTASNAYCVESGRRCFVEKSGDAYHFVTYNQSGFAELPKGNENTVIFNHQLYLRQTDGSFTLAPDGYYTGRRLWRVADGQMQEVFANARDQVHKTGQASADMPDFYDETEIFFDPQRRIPVAFWNPTLKIWVALGSAYRAYNPVYEGQRYYVPENVDGRYYTDAELRSPITLGGQVYTDEQVKAARNAALTALGSAK